MAQDELGLETISEDGTPPSSRLRDARSAHDVYRRLRDADLQSSADRAKIRAMFDGEPPWKHSDLVEQGQADRCNLNFGEAAALKEQALAGFYDLTNSVDNLVTVYTSYGDPAQRPEFEQIIAEEFTRMVREWPQFEYNHQLLCEYFVAEGVGICYFEDASDWRWRVDSLANFFVPRGTAANERGIEVAVCTRSMQAHQLYNFIKYPEKARAMGWNVDAVRRLLLEHCKQTDPERFSRWEELEEEFKNNDIGFNYARSATVNLNHIWVQEFDGKVSHFITDRAGQLEDFVFKRLRRFDSMNQAFTIFTYGVGNGTLHSIRGLGFKIFNHIQVSNRLNCALVDGAILSSSIMVTTDQSGRGLDDLALTYFGPLMLFPPGLKTLEKQAAPNFQQNALPVINHLGLMLQNNASGYRTRAVTPDDQARTAYEIRAQLQREAILSAASVNLFYGHQRRLFREVFRRVQQKDYGADKPGGREVQDFFRRCRERGVPSEAIYEVYRVEPERAIGLGSPAMRALALEEMGQMVGFMDEFGKVNWARDKMALRLNNYAAVDRYIPRPERGVRPVMDEKIALMENLHLAEGQGIPVSPAENHFVHARVHIDQLVEVTEALGQGAMEPPVALAAMRAGVEHTNVHVELLADDKVRASEVAGMRQTLQQIGAMADRIEASLQAQAENEAKAAEAEAQRQLESQEAYIRELERKAGDDPKLQQELRERQAKLAMDVEAFRQKQQLAAMEAQQRMALRDAETASRIAGQEPPPIRGRGPQPPTEG